MIYVFSWARVWWEPSHHKQESDLEVFFFASQIQKMLQAILLNREVWKFTNEDSLLNRICPKIVLLKLNFSCESSVHFKKLQLS